MPRYKEIKDLKDFKVIGGTRKLFYDLHYEQQNLKP